MPPTAFMPRAVLDARVREAQGLGVAMGSVDLASLVLATQLFLAPRPERPALYVEWGAGGSTRLVLRTTNATVHSLDSSSAWLQAVATNLSDAERARYHPHLADIGTVQAWGRPTAPPPRSARNLTSTARQKRAQLSIRQMAKMYARGFGEALERADVVLIDGRWRVRCALEAYRRAREGALIMVHDFFSRNSYASVSALFQRLVVRRQQAAAADAAHGRAEAPAAWEMVGLGGVPKSGHVPAHGDLALFMQRRGQTRMPETAVAAMTSFFETQAQRRRRRGRRRGLGEAGEAGGAGGS